MKIKTIVRFALTGLLLAGVYSETGVFTTLTLLLVFCALEILPVILMGTESPVSPSQET